MGIKGYKWIKKEENNNNSISMSKAAYEQYKKDADDVFNAFFGDIMKKTEFVEKKRG